MRARPTNKSIAAFQKRLLGWYGINGRTFPWRSQKLSPYEIVLTEILLQRTKAETVKNFHSKFFESYASWFDLGNASLSELQDTLKPLGLNKQRGARLFALAQAIKNRNYQFPTDKSSIESLPFMGQYIFNSVRLLILNEPAPLLDVNMARLLERYFGERELSDIRYDPYIQKLSHTIITHAESKNLNWAVLDFASLICVANRPKCDRCIFTDKCKFFKTTKTRN